MSTTAPNLVQLPLAAIRPYWRNPRDIPPEAVEQVRASIDRYGYQAPIIVDREHVIIAGHTRYAALRALDIEDVWVVISDLDPDKAKEYRLVDNRAGELASWDADLLAVELREWETALADQWFPEVDLLPEITTNAADLVTTERQITDAEEKVADPGEPPRVQSRTVTCPHCYQSFDVDRSTLPDDVAD